MADIEIFIVATKRKPVLTTEYLKGIDYCLNYTPDYELEPAWRVSPIYVDYVENQICAYRCFKGHQDVLKKMNSDIALVFEDDAVLIEKTGVIVLKNLRSY